MAECEDREVTITPPEEDDPTPSGSMTKDEILETLGYTEVPITVTGSNGEKVTVVVAGRVSS